MPSSKRSASKAGEPRPGAQAWRPDPHATSPLYVQLTRHLAEQIERGHLPPREPLPSERALAEQWGLSRVTTRRAIDELVSQGRVERRHGAGNYVLPQLAPRLSRLSSFTEELRERGYVAGSVWLLRQTGKATQQEQQMLALAPRSPVARLERLRLADGNVMALERSVLPQAILPDPQSLQHSLYAALAARQCLPQRAVQQLRAMHADATMAEHLGVPIGRALLHITRIAYAADGRPQEWTQSFCRSDRYVFISELSHQR